MISCPTGIFMQGIANSAFLRSKLVCSITQSTMNSIQLYNGNYFLSFYYVLGSFTFFPLILIVK